MTLSIYIARRYLTMFLMVFGGFFAVLYLIEMVEQVRRFSDASLGQTAELALLNVPATLYRILPLIAILSAIALFLALARSSELVVIRAAGRSALRMLLAPLLAALALGIFAVAVLNPIVAGTGKRYDEMSSRFRLGTDNAMSVSGEGIWLRQGGPDGQMVIRADRANGDGTTFEKVSFIKFAPESGPVSRIDAETATLEQNDWAVRDAKEWHFGSGANPERDAVRHDALRIASDLTPDQIRDSFGTPSSIPIWQLPAFMAGLEKAGFSARRHHVWFQMELALPLLMAAMVLVAAGFTMRHARAGRTGTMVLLAVIAGFAIFLLRNFAQVLGENGQIPVIAAAWSPPVAALLLALTLVLHLEDG